jgi:hypothetical protein
MGADEGKTFWVVCPACFARNEAGGNVEVNFAEGSIHMVCPTCKKSSSMIIDSSKNYKPLPKTRLQ